MALILCPECKKQISSRALTCPMCGFPMQSAKNAPRTFKQDIADVGKTGFWIWLLISLPGLTVPTLIAKIMTPGNAGSTEVKAILDLLVLTMPLTLAVAFVGVGVLRKWVYLTGKNPPGGGCIGALFLLIPLLVTTFVSNLFGLDAGVSIRDAWAKSGHPIFGFLANMLLGYAKAYGLWNFISSLVVGGFLAWAWAKKILPHLLGENK